MAKKSITSTQENVVEIKPIQYDNLTYLHVFLNTNDVIETKIDLLPSQIIGEINKSAEKHQFYEISPSNFIQTANIIRIEILHAKSLRLVSNESLIENFKSIDNVKRSTLINGVI